MPSNSAELFEAIRTKDVTKVKQVLAAGVSPNERDPAHAVGHRALSYACFHSAEIVKVLIDAGADVNQESPLTIAAESGNAEMIRILVAAKADVNRQRKDGNTALIIVAGDLERTQALLAGRADPNIKNKKGMTALRTAVRKKSRGEDTPAIVQSLIAAGADPNEGDPWTVLSTAARIASPEIVQALIAGGAKINSLTAVGTALIQAIKANRVDNVTVLLAAGADADLRVPADSPLRDIGGLTALEIAIKEKRKHIAALLDPSRKYPEKEIDAKAIVQMLAKIAKKDARIKAALAGADFATMSPGQVGEWLLTKAVALGDQQATKILLDAGIDANRVRGMLHLLDVKLARLLLDAGLDPNTGDGDWLCTAAQQGNAKMVKLLVEYAVPVDHVSKDGETALTEAAEHEKREVVQLLLDAGADPNLPGRSDKVALFYAAREGRGEIVRSLLKAGADLKKAEGGLLFYAVSGKEPARLDAVQALIEAGADVNWQNRILGEACGEEGSPEIVQALIDAGASVNATARGWTALHSAAFANRGDLAQVLLKAGADPNVRPVDPDSDLDGMTPLELAKSRKARKVIPVLEAATAGKGKAAKSAKAAKPQKSASVADTWKRIDAWLKTHNPKLAKALNKGVTDKEIAQAEAKLGVKLPSDFKESYQLHNGQKEGDLIPPPNNNDSGYILLPLKDILNEWKMWKGLIDKGEFANDESNPAKGIRTDWWHPGWIPFASNGGGDSFCIDLAPAKGGKAGQIITMNHESAERELLAPSFAAWLATLAEDLENVEDDEE